MTNKKCTLVLSSNFKKQYKKVAKQGKDLNKIDYVIDIIKKLNVLIDNVTDGKIVK